jgi:hypothetical protein
VPIFVPIFVQKTLSKEKISLRKRKYIFCSKIPETIDNTRKARNLNGLWASFFWCARRDLNLHTKTQIH